MGLHSSLLALGDGRLPAEFNGGATVRRRKLLVEQVVWLVIGLPLFRNRPMPVGAHVGDQLFRSGTSVEAHLQEARAAESRADFIHKMGMALKECREAKYWLDLITRADVLKCDMLLGLLCESDELVAILTRSVATAKARTASPQTSDGTR